MSIIIKFKVTCLPNISGKNRGISEIREKVRDRKMYNDIKCELKMFLMSKNRKFYAKGIVSSYHQ